VDFRHSFRQKSGRLVSFLHRLEKRFGQLCPVRAKSRGQRIARTTIVNWGQAIPSFGAILQKS
jgi:hypothetical protein